MNRVVVTGLGALCGLGRNLDEVWKNALAGRSGISKLVYPPAEEMPVKVAGQIEDFKLDPSILSPKEAPRYDRFLHLGLSAGMEAFSDANLDSHDCDPKRMGVILGVGMGGFKTIEDNHETFRQKGGRRVSPFFIPGSIPNMISGLLSIKLSLRGVNYTVSSACASSNHALAQAFLEIRHGLHDIVLSGGVESILSYLPFFAFANMKALSKRPAEEASKASRPFDRDRDGFVIGEGAGILVLENAQRAKARGAKIYAELVSFGTSSDAHHITSSHPEGRGCAECMVKALSLGDIPPEEIDYVNAHGTSTPLGDKAETKALKEVFGQRARSLAISSTKSMTGHLLGAAGGLESIFCAKAIETGLIPPTINLDNPDPECDLFYVPHQSIKKEIRYALNNSFGFGGTNASIIFQRPS